MLRVAHLPRARYAYQHKFIFQDASWQGRQFLSLTQLHWDGTSRVMHAILDQQVSFGMYHPGMRKNLEFKHEHTFCTPEVGIETEFAAAGAYDHLLSEDTLHQLLRDKEFIQKVKQAAIRENHSAFIAAANDLQRGICRDKMIVLELPFNYREWVTRRYFQFLLSCNPLIVNPDPLGQFNEIYFNLKGSKQEFDVGHPGCNNLPITAVAARSIHDELSKVAKAMHPDNPAIFHYQFLGQAVPHNEWGSYLEISRPSEEQKHTVDSLFAVADKAGFFPSDPQKMIRKAWKARAKMLAENLKTAPISMFADSKPSEEKSSKIAPKKP